MELNWEMGEQLNVSHLEEGGHLQRLSLHTHVFPLLLFNKLCVAARSETLCAHLSSALGTRWREHGRGFSSQVATG